MEKAWADVQTLRPIVEAHRDEAEALRRLPEAIARAFLERDVYRLMLPVDLGGAGLDILQHFDLTLEVSRVDGSTGWLYCLAGNGAFLAGAVPPSVAQGVFATPDCCGAAAGAPTGRAVAVEGGYWVSGRWAWASGIHQARHVTGNCIVFDGDQPRVGAHGEPIVLMVIVPIENVRVLDVWHTAGMRGTGSTEFEIDGLFMPHHSAFAAFNAPPSHPHPIFKLPTSYFGFGMGAVALGVAYSTVEAFKGLARSKKLTPPRTTLAEKPSVQFIIAKAEAMIEAVHISLREAGVQLWNEVCTNGAATMPARARIRRALVHAVDTCIDAVGMCFREAGGSAVFRAAPFERPLRDLYSIGAHASVQRAMMEDAGRVVLGLDPLSGMF